MRHFNLVQLPTNQAVKCQALFLNPQGAVIFQDDGVALVHSLEPGARVNRQHREPHAEIRRQNPVATKTLDLVVVSAGVKEAEHGRRLSAPAALAVKMVNISYFRNIKVQQCGTLI